VKKRKRKEVHSRREKKKLVERKPEFWEEGKHRELSKEIRNCRKAFEEEDL